MNKYIRYIQSPEWRIKRDNIISQRKCCEKCGKETSLQVHHGSYKNLCNEKEDELFLLCKSCHKLFHKTYGFKNLLKSTKSFIANKFIDKESTTRKRGERLSRTEANSIIPSNEFIEYVKIGGKYSGNIFTKSIRLFNSVVRRYGGTPN